MEEHQENRGLKRVHTLAIILCALAATASAQAESTQELGVYGSYYGILSANGSVDMAFSVTTSTTMTTLEEGGESNFTRKDSGYALQLVTPQLGSGDLNETLRMPFVVSSSMSTFTANESGYRIEGNFYTRGIGGSHT